MYIHNYILDTLQVPRCKWLVILNKDIIYMFHLEVVSTAKIARTFSDFISYPTNYFGFTIIVLRSICIQMKHAYHVAIILHMKKKEK